MDWAYGFLCYFLGAFTFVPLVLWVMQLYVSVGPPAPLDGTGGPQEVDVTTSYNFGAKKGWIRLSSNYQPKTSHIGKKKGTTKQAGEGFGVFKQGILKVYADEMQQQLEWVMDLEEYTVSLHPPGRNEHILFSRSVALKLERKTSTNSSPSSSSASSSSSSTKSSSQVSSMPTATSESNKIQDAVVYFTCSRPIDKEDWYFAFMSTSHANTPGYHAIPFDPMAVAALITSIGHQQQQHKKDDKNEKDELGAPTVIPWFNAVLGRTFLAIYKTRRFRQYVLETLAKKTKKMKTPGFLGDIQVRDVDVGMAMPLITQPKLVALHADGTLVLDAQVDYQGGFKVVVEANAAGAFSIRVPLLLSLTLQSLSGTVRFKIKPPPSNRYWIGFCTMPTMKWSIVPAVSNRNVKIALVTKIIEAKIRRMMTDNMVCPNMEDVPFARSDGKGGIFNDDNDLVDDLNDADNGIPQGPNPMDTSLQQSFVIQQQDKDTSSIYSSNSSDTIPSQTPTSSSSGRWSRLLFSRRKKSESKEEASEAVARQVHGSEKEEATIPELSMRPPTPPRPPQTCEKHEKSEKSEKHESEPVVDDDPSNSRDMDRDGSQDDGASVRSARSTSSSTSVGTTATAKTTSSKTTSSTRRRKLYNAAGYLLSKGKTLANDLRDHKQQELQLKRQRSLMQYADQLEDMRRRCNENEIRRMSNASLHQQDDDDDDQDDDDDSKPSPTTPTDNANASDASTPASMPTPLSQSVPILSNLSQRPIPTPEPQDDSSISYESVSEQPPLPPRRQFPPPPPLPPRA
ncbi:putative integral membrane protein conserved region-domain-containing protein [Gongronella butleri]|nr:putative integral membrane protein conserved region-domain-containing protein [Gongronella butleri]